MPGMLAASESFCETHRVRSGGRTLPYLNDWSRRSEGEKRSPKRTRKIKIKMVVGTGSPEDSSGFSPTANSINEKE